MTTTYRSHYTIPHQCRTGWSTFATQAEADADQSTCTHPDGVTTEAASEYPTDEEWVG